MGDYPLELGSSSTALRSRSAVPADDKVNLALRPAYPVDRRRPIRRKIARMKKACLSLAALLISIFSVFAAAQVFGWQPIVFQLSKSAIAPAIEAMRARHDSALAAFEAQYPGATEAYVDNFAKFATLGMNAFVAAPDVAATLSFPFAPKISGHRDSGLQIASHQVGRAIKSLEIFIHVSETAALNASDSEVNVPYRYCELHPEETDDLCANVRAFFLGGTYVLRPTAANVFLRRLVSEPLFVQNACPQIAPFAAWYLTRQHFPLAASPEQRARQLAPLMAALYGVIDQLYGDGIWNQARVTEYLSGMYAVPNENQPRLHSNIGIVLANRYLDGGPELLLAAKSCLRLIESALYQPFEKPSAEVAPEVAKLISFTADQDSGLDVAFEMPGLIQEARLTHRFGVNLPFPSESVISSDDEYNGISRQNSMLADGAVFQIAHELSGADLVFKYRPMSRTDFDRLSETSKILLRAREFCVVDSLPDPKASTGAIPAGSCFSSNSGKWKPQTPFEVAHESSIFYPLVREKRSDAR